ncbi:hypothetical protein Pst134EB_020343 [Puccinia striiformis f. sp. tritici]|nr:hypothetical protein Pst134EB_020343 [Puccinia striiformis f. sp. tritici]
MGTAIHADGPIHRDEVLASCSAEVVIDRKNCLDRIGKLFRRLQSLDEKTHTERNGEVLDCFLGQDRRSLDRTVISLYLILTKLSLKIRSQQSEGPCDQVTPDPSQTVHLLNELFSFHEEYVRLLPETDDLMTPIFWKNAELQKLHTTSLLYSVNQQKQLWTSEYESLIGKILGLSPSLHDFMARHTSCLDYFWASTIVTSRSFPSTLMATSSDIPAHPTCPSHPAIPSFPPVEAVPILLPGVDIFNHKRGSKIEWKPIRHESRVQRIEIVSLEDQIARGDQVFNNYGPKSTAELILGYGFALGEEDWKNSRGEGTEETGMVNNPDDFYAIKLSRPPAGQVYSPLISNIFNRFETDDLLHHIRRDGMLPPLLLAQLRISVISSDEEVDQASQCLHEALSLHNSKDFLNAFATSMTNKLNWENELNCLDCLRAMLTRKLEELLQQPAGNDWTQVREPVRRMVEIYRQGQLGILNDALEALEDTFELTMTRAKADGFQFDSEDDDEG